MKYFGSGPTTWFLCLTGQHKVSTYPRFEETYIANIYFGVQ